MQCDKCNTELMENAKFCFMCGTSQHTTKKCKLCTSDMPKVAILCAECGFIFDSSKYKVGNGYTIDYMIDSLNCWNKNVLGPICINGKWGYRNEKDQLVIPFQYDEASGFQEINSDTYGACVKKDGFYGVINKNNELIIPNIFFNVLDSPSALRDEKPSFAVHLTQDLGGWARVFINLNMDVAFDVGSQERFFSQYPEGYDWFIKHNKYFSGRECVGYGNYKPLEI